MRFGFSTAYCTQIWRKKNSHGIVMQRCGFLDYELQVESLQVKTVTIWFFLKQKIVQKVSKWRHFMRCKEGFSGFLLILTSSHWFCDTFPWAIQTRVGYFNCFSFFHIFLLLNGNSQKLWITIFSFLSNCFDQII